MTPRNATGAGAAPAPVIEEKRTGDPTSPPDSTAAAAGGRDRFEDVGRSTRAVLVQAAKSDPPLKAAEWRVLASVLALTATWSRHEDRYSVPQIARTAGMRRERSARESLTALRDRGLIVYKARRGRPRAGESGRMCTIGIPHGDVDIRPPVPPHITSEGIRPPGVTQLPGNPAPRGDVINPAPRGDAVPGVNPAPRGADTRELPREELPTDVGGRGPAVAQDPPEPPGSDRQVHQVFDLIARKWQTNGSRLRTYSGKRGEPGDDGRPNGEHVRDALAGGRWSVEPLAAHLYRTEEPIKSPAGWLRTRLRWLPESPADCDKPCCSAARAARHQAARQASREAERRADAAKAEQAETDNRISLRLGEQLRGRIVGAWRAANPTAPSSTPGLVRGVLAAFYAEHGHDLGRVRAAAEQLPEPGPEPETRTRRPIRRPA